MFFVADCFHSALSEKPDDFIQFLARSHRWFRVAFANSDHRHDLFVFRDIQFGPDYIRIHPRMIEEAFCGPWAMLIVFILHDPFLSNSYKSD